MMETIYCLLPCGMIVIIAVALLSNRHVRHWIGDLLASDSDEAKREKPWG